MGRFDFRSQRAYDAVRDLVQAKRVQYPPPWFNTVANVPPTASQLLVRPAFRHVPKKKKKASKLFLPVKINYPEDQLRQKYFSDHPWELARPKVVLESDGKNYQQENWEKLQQPSRRLDGESAVQRQMYLMRHKQMGRDEAYDRARTELYAYRHRQDVERRVAREESLLTGSSFGLSQVDIGIHLEGEAYEDWKQWAQEEALRKRQEAAAMYTDTDNEQPSDSIEAKGEESLIEEYEDDEVISTVKDDDISSGENVSK